jgi:hypothetical protein
MACLNCNGVQKAAKKAANIIEGYKHMIIKDAIVEKMYNERIMDCNVCTKRINIPIAKIGVCRICGCVIEAKARVKDEHCPDNPSKW